MSNRTVRGAHQVHGQDPQLLVEKIIRERIYDCLYWKEECFGLNAETILDKAVELNYVGGTFGNQRPVPFLCLLLKLLQIQPTLPIIDEYIQQADFKYLRVLALFYYRLVGSPAAVYTKLEPYLADRRRLRLRQPSGVFALSHVDTVVDDLLTQERVFGIILPRLPKRTVLEDADELDPRPFFFPLEEDDRGRQEEGEEGGQRQSTEEQPADFSPQTSAGTMNSARLRESLSVEETNAIRAKLGLAPLSSTDAPPKAV